MEQHQASNHEGERANGFLRKLTDIFDRKAGAGSEHLIKDTFVGKFNDMVEHMAPADQNRIMVKIQRGLVTIGGYMHEYGARIADFVRNTVNAPMVMADEKFPKNAIYTEVLSMAESWGNHAKNTQKTATDARNSYRDHFLPTAATGALQGAVFGGLYGALEGSKYGLVANGPHGAVVGAGVGGALGVLAPIVMRIKDKLMGPPVLYYSIFSFIRRSPIKITLPANQYA
jgi:hypothetical protein